MARDPDFLYTVAVRIKNAKDPHSTWELKQIPATSIVEVSRELATPLDDLKYVSKERLK